MADFSTIKATIDANIKTNGNEEITGAIMNSVLKEMIDSVNQKKSDPVTIDASMSDSSTNPAQNKVVKAYVDEKEMYFEDGSKDGDTMAIQAIDVWGNVTQTDETNTIFDGEQRMVKKIIVNSVAGGVFGFMPQSPAIEDVSVDVGEIVNYDVALYSPISGTYALSKYAGQGQGAFEIENFGNTITLKEGINFFHFRLKCTSSTDYFTLWQIYFGTADFVGKTFYLFGFAYKGLRRMTFNQTPIKVKDGINKLPFIANADAGLYVKSTSLTAIQTLQNKYPRIDTGVLQDLNNSVTGIFDVTGKAYFYLEWQGINPTYYGIALSDDATFSTIYFWHSYSSDNGNAAFATMGYKYAAVCVSHGGQWRGKVYDVQSPTNGIGQRLDVVEDKVEEIENQFSLLFENEAFGRDDFHLGGGGLVETINADGSRNYKIAAGAGTNTWCWFSFKLGNSNKWQYGHKYYVAIDGLYTQNSLTEGSTSAAGNNYLDVLPKANLSVPPIGTFAHKTSLVTGSRGIYKGVISITTSGYDQASMVFVQFGKYSNTDYLDFTIYDVSVIDMGEDYKEFTYDEADALFTKYGFVKSVQEVAQAKMATEAMRARVAESLESFVIGRDIDIWGDSLTAQGWGNNLASITGRNVYSHGYGGRTSTYIRDQFLAGYNRNRTNIFWVGRNNFSRPDAIIDDIRTMVDTLGTDDFIIMSNLNGSYEGEYKGQGGYAKFTYLAEQLRTIYPDNFVDIRSAIIRGWLGTGIKLLAPFTQPSVGSSVQINVSDAIALTTLNEYDVQYIGTEIMNKIVIGENGSYDVYSIVSCDDATHCTIELVNANRIQPGNQVANPVDPLNTPVVGTSSAIEYLRVMQNGDYYCINTLDTTPSTARQDRIHQSAAGKEFTAKVIARALASRKI